MKGIINMEAIEKNIIDISETALSELVRLNVNKENFLRIGIIAGGCSGLSYEVGIDNEYNDVDKVIYENEQLRVVADNESFNSLGGLVIDYSDDLMEAGFRFQNPNASSTCGCGNSFCQ